MALTAVDLSLAAKRVTPTLDHDLILGNTALAVGSRAGVASLQVVKDTHRRWEKSRSADRPRAAHQRETSGGTRAETLMLA